MELLVYFLIIAIFIKFGFGFVYEDRFVTVRTTNGPVRGLKKMVQGKRIYSFLGIPYAQPPIGNLRFKNPVNASNWDMFYATKLPKTCYQNLPEDFELNNAAFRMWTNNTEMSEDCLYLNIWTPSLISLNSRVDGRRSTDRINTGRKRKVSRKYPRKRNVKTLKVAMVWIHGDDFTSGSSTLDVYNGEILASKTNVIVVSINYRLGALGFLHWDAIEAPGNQGLMDQVMALEWLNQNLEYFGGNKNFITLFGSQSGAVSASLHLVSPLTQHLFNQAILQSSTGLAWWAAETPKQARNRTHNLALLSGCSSSREILPCLRSLHPSTIILNQYRIGADRSRERTKYREKLLRYHYRGKFESYISNQANLFFDIPFKPVLNTPYLPMDPYLYLQPKDGNYTIKKRRVLLGVNKNEGLQHMVRGLRKYFMPGYTEIMEEPQEFRYRGSEFDPLDFLALFLLDEPYLFQMTIQAVAFEYEIPSMFLQQRDWRSREVIEALDHVTGDYNFKCSVIDFADLYTQITKVYMYSFEQETQNLPLPKWTGVMMGQEIAYIFGKPFDTEFQRNYFNFTNDERHLSMKMMQMWTNFAQTGHPSHGSKDINALIKKMQWDIYKENKFNRNLMHIVFHNNTMKMSTNLRRHQCVFWRKFMPQLRQDFVINAKCASRTKYVSQVMMPVKEERVKEEDKSQTSKPQNPIKYPPRSERRFDLEINEEPSNTKSHNSSARKSSSPLHFSYPFVSISILLFITLLIHP